MMENILNVNKISKSEIENEGTQRVCWAAPPNYRLRPTAATRRFFEMNISVYPERSARDPLSYYKNYFPELVLFD